MDTLVADYSDLVNAPRLRSSIRRLFTGGVGEILAELLQNSQRAGARHAHVSTGDGVFTFSDDGHGIDGLDGFHALLRLAESGFENPDVAEQDPMGLGFSALLCHEAVSSVRLESSGLAVEIDPARWWTDADYYSSWADRVTTARYGPGAGLRVTAVTTKEFLDTVRRVLASSAAGYEGVLEVTLDGEAVDTALPFSLRHFAPVYAGEYEGCRVSVEEGSNSAIVWYGQLISIKEAFPGFSVVMHVGSGRPVNPMSPSRRGIIRDDRWNAFVAWVKDRVFEVLCDDHRREGLTPRFVKACHKLDRARAHRESPVYVAAAYATATGWYDSVEEVSCTRCDEVAAYGEERLLLDDRIDVRLPDGDLISDAYGLDGFLPMLERDAYRLVCGSAERARLRHVVWMPGAGDGTGMFFAPGQWGLVGNDGVESALADVTGDCVWAFTETACWDVGDVDWVVSTPDRVAFYERCGAAGFEPHSDDLGQSRASFGRSVADAVRCELGNAVSRTFSYEDIQRLFTGRQVIGLTFVRTGGGQPTAIDVGFADGTTERLSFYE